MAQRTRKQALLPVAVGALVAGAVCYGVARIPEPVRDGRQTASVGPLSDVSVTTTTRDGRTRVRVANTGPDPTGPLTLRSTASFTARDRHCKSRTCVFPAGLAPGTSLTFTLKTRHPATLNVRTSSTDWSPADNTAGLLP